MADKSGFTMDFSEFDKVLVETARKVPDQAKKGIASACHSVLQDSIYEQPYAPFKEGHLRGSARVERVDDNLEGTFGFNIEYAARWHELSPAEDSRIKWTLPGSGRKYMESKMVRNANRYLKIVAEAVGRVFGGK